MHLRTRIVLFVVVVVTLVMTLVPPWYVRERQWAAEAFGPERAVGYSFITSPPHQSNGKITTAIARIDLTRLTLQYVAALLVAGGTVLALGWKRPNSGWLTFTHGSSKEEVAKRKEAVVIADQATPGPVYVAKKHAAERTRA